MSHQSRITHAARGFGAALAHELQPSRLVSSVMATGVAGAVALVQCVTFGALVFSGGLADYAGYGIGMALLGACVAGLIVTLFTSFPGSIVAVQSTPAAIIAVGAFAVTNALPPGTPGRTAFVNVAVYVTLCTCITGVALFALGHFRLGNLVRFLPYPVIGGFLAGTGWLLVAGAFRLLVGESVSKLGAGALFQPSVAAHWLAGVLVAAAFVLALARYRQPTALPAMIALAIAVFFGLAVVSGAGPDDLARSGWLMGPFSGGTLRAPPDFVDLAVVDVRVVLQQAPSMATAAGLTAVALLLNATGLEVAARRDVVFNRELRAVGIGNLAASLGGSLVSYHLLGATMLNQRISGGSRLVGLAVSALCGATLLAGAGVIALFPRAVAGGLLLYLGFSLLKEWLWDARLRLPVIEHLIVIVILVVIAAAGLFEGIAVGTVAAVAMFVVAYSRTDVVRHELSGQIVQSRMLRDMNARRLLSSEGAQVHILRLQGFVFFGTAERLLNQVRQRTERADLPKLAFVVLDFKRVTGMDSSGVASLHRLKQAAVTGGFHLVICDASGPLRRQLDNGGLKADATITHFTDFDQALEWCENSILATAGTPQSGSGSPLQQQLAALLPDPLAVNGLLPYLKRRDVVAGARLIRQGEPADSMFFIESGQVTTLLESSSHAPMRLETLTAGGMVGEVGFYLRQPRSATVMVDAPSVVYELCRDDLDVMEREQPMAAAALHRLCSHALAERVSHLNRLVNMLQQ